MGFLDDLPWILVSAMRAAREIGPDDKTALVRFPGADGEFYLRLHQRPMMHGVKFSFFLCPGCGRRARRLWLFEGQPACQYCLSARGVRHRVKHLSQYRRAEYRAPKLRAMLSSPTPLMKNRRNRQRMERRAALERALVLCELRLRRTRAEGQFK